ncbi:MAG: VanZ family protein [Dermatophilaceae bacterium]
MAAALLALAGATSVVFLAALDRHLQGRARGPIVAVGLLGVAAAVGVFAQGRRLADSTLAPVSGNGAAVAVLVAVVATGAAWWTTRRAPAGLLVVIALAIVGTTTWLPTSGWPARRPDGVERLRVCLVTDPRWGTPGWTGLLTDALPNAALYLPLGIALGAALTRHRWTAVVLGAALSLGSEVHQALFTDRVCKVNDTLTNVLGTAAGVALLWSARRWTQRSPSGRPPARLG